MNRATYILLLLLYSISYSQNEKGFNSVYDVSKISLSNSNSYQREKWFYEQRLFPFGYFSEEIIQNAYKHKTDLLRARGYYEKYNNWVSLGPTPGINNYYGNVSSRIAAVKFNPVNPEIIYIGAAYGGV